MVKLVFAANRPTYERFLRYYQLSPNEYYFARSKESMLGLNHVNCQFVLTDGYAVNPCFGTDRYMIVKRMAEQDNRKDFIIKMLVHDKEKERPSVKMKEDK